MLKLILKRRAEIISEFKLSKKKVITIGNAKGNDIIINDKKVSEYHCKITKEKGKYVLSDNNTLSGTKVIFGTSKEEKNITVHELQVGDKIKFDVYSLEFRSIIDKKEIKKQEITHFLLGIYGKFEGKKYELSSVGETYIGREDTNPKGINNDIVLENDMTCSKGHAKISYTDKQYILTDIGSTGGTAINGEKIGQFNDVVIKSKDEITIGRNIFRMVEEGKENYFAPKRHAILLLKLKYPFYVAMLTVVLTAAVIAIYKGVVGVQTINYVPKVLDIRPNYSRLVQENTTRTTLPPYDISSSLCISDINNDGVNDIVYLNSSGLLCAWDGCKGKLLWKPVEIPNSGIGSPAIADINNDGVKDIVCLSNTSMLYVIDGQTGGIIFREMLGGTISELSPAVADLNLDGKPDIVVCAEEGMLYFIYSPGYGSEMEKIVDFVEGPIYSSPVIIATEKILPTVVICSNSSKVFLFSGKTGEKKTIDLTEKTGKAHLLAAAPAIGDLDGDGVPEIIVQSNVPQYISAIDITRLKVNWTYFVEPVPPSGIKHTSSPVIADMDNDGLSDVVIFSANGMVYALKGKTEYVGGELLWKDQLPGVSKTISSPVLYDFNKDGMMDMVFGTEDGYIDILGNSIRDKKRGFLFSSKVGDVPITSSVMLGDTNGDGYLDIIYNDMMDAIKIITTNLKVFKNRIYCPMYFVNASRTALPNKEDITLYRNLILVGTSVCLLLLTAIGIVRKKRRSKRPRVVVL